MKELLVVGMLMLSNIAQADYACEIREDVVPVLITSVDMQRETIRKLEDEKIILLKKNKQLAKEADKVKNDNLYYKTIQTIKHLVNSIK